MDLESLVLARLILEVFYTNSRGLLFIEAHRLGLDLQP